MIERGDKSRFFHEKTKHVILEEEEIHDRTGRPVVCPQRGARTQQFIIGDNEAESELLLGSRSSLHRVNDRVRKVQEQSSKDATQDSNKHSFFNMVNVYVFDITSICIHGKGLLGKFTHHQKYRKRSHNETDV